MKKNLLTIVILALLIVNIILTSVMMFSVMGTNKKTAELVTNIATALNLELTVPGEVEEEIISLADTQVLNLTGSLTVPLVMDGGTQKYMMFNVTLSMNTKHEDYETYSATISDYEQLIKSAISDVVSTHTEFECRNDSEGLKAEMLAEVQELFQSDFIYNVSISDVKIG
ncbi:MAG: flagellar basal body-associated protein FliL [Lachnospiraceae bacterium]|nr:flagellar basal body-associated protein FliL [Lachnospiraceae bacterium]